MQIAVETPPGEARRNSLIAITCAIGAAIAFSLNDVGIKFLSGDYALHQIVLFRSLAGTLFLCALVLPFQGGFAALKTRRLGLHLIRGATVVMANLIFFAALATLPLAEAVAIFFVSPLMITALSVIVLGERVGPRRWIAVFVGFIGVLVVMQPGSAAFTWAAVFPLLAAFCYACLHMMTRRLGRTDSAATMAIYIQFCFIAVSVWAGLFIGDGKLNVSDDATLQFLTRAWAWPPAGDYWILTGVGIASALGGFMISQAYRLSEAAVVAPFEYVAMPASILWGFAVFGEVPGALSWAGIALILVSGIVVALRSGSRVRR